MYFTIHHHKSVTSTNDVLKQLFIDGNASDRTVVIADEQTNGRGRGHHTWISPVGSLSISICLTTCNPLPSFHLQFVTSLSVVKSIEAVSVKKLNIQIRWPNDVLIHGKKVAGILIEQLSGAYEATIVGIGINSETTTFSKELKNKATSLACEGIENISKEIVQEKILSTFAKQYDQYLKEGFATILAQWKNYWKDEGKIITVINHWNEPLYSGILLDIDADGFLILQPTVGDKVHLNGGDCHVLYPWDNA
jgi:BirA family biotin operon repressor/biotin-[acetyl-CoA-carboxylase] ligase